MKCCPTKIKAWIYTVLVSLVTYTFLYLPEIDGTLISFIYRKGNWYLESLRIQGSSVIVMKEGSEIKSPVSGDIFITPG